MPDFAHNEPLTWFRRAETRFRIRGIVQPTTRADYVLEALPEAIFARIGPWLDQQPDEIPYDDLKKHLLKEFSPTTSERARRLLSLPSQPMGDRKPSHLWDEICTLSRLPEVDAVSKQHKEVDLKKEIWLKSLPSCVRVLLRNTDDKSMGELSSLADDITMSQKAACFPTVSTAVEQQEHLETTIDDVMPVRQVGTHTEQQVLALSLVDSATTTGGSAVMHDTAPRAANGLQKTPEAAVSKENGRQRFTPSSLGSQCNTSLSSWIFH